MHTFLHSLSNASLLFVLRFASVSQAVALPIYFATRSKSLAVRLALISGLAEPAGVLFVLALIHVFGVLSKAFVAALMAGVAGVMVALSAAELFPQALMHCGRRDAIASTVAGIVVMSLLLRAIETFGIVGV